MSFFILFFGLILRRKWLGAAAVWLILNGFALRNFDSEPLFVVGQIVANTVLVFIATRFGVVAALAFFLLRFLDDIPFTTDLSDWYSGNFILFVMILVGLSFYGFYTSIAGAKIFGGKSLLEE